MTTHYLPLTSEQSRCLDVLGNRVWTATEVATIKNNVACYDKVRRILSRRCSVPDCRYVISSLDECLRIPFVGDVCGVCYHMHQALQHPGLKNTHYFLDLHNAWKDENDPDKRKKWRDKLGL